MIQSFAITIWGEHDALVVAGYNLSGETWDDCLLRLYHSILPNDAPRHRIGSAARQPGAIGGATNFVYLRYTNGDGKDIAGTTLFISTSPPQF